MPCQADFVRTAWLGSSIHLQIRQQWIRGRFFYTTNNTTNTQQPNSSHLWFWIYLLVPPSSLSISLRAFSHCCVTVKKLLLLFDLKNAWNETLKFLLNVNSTIQSRTQIWEYLFSFIVVHTALMSFKEEEDHCVLCARQNNLKCQLLLVFTQLKGSDNTVGFPDTIFSSFWVIFHHFVKMLTFVSALEQLTSIEEQMSSVN